MMVMAGSVLPGCLLLSVCMAVVRAQTRDLQATSTTGNYQLGYDRSVIGGDPLGNLPLDDPRLQRTVQGNGPEQVQLRLCPSLALQAI